MGEEKIVDNRSFQQLWKELTRMQKATLQFALIKSRCCTTRQTVWNWATGKKRPVVAAQKEVARVTGLVVGKRQNPEILFPDGKRAGHKTQED